MVASERLRLTGCALSALVGMSWAAAPAVADGNPNPPPRAGDWVVALENPWGVFVFDPSGADHSFVSGFDVRPVFVGGAALERGSGPAMDIRARNPWPLLPDGRLLGRDGDPQNESLVATDLFTGQRAVWEGTPFAPGEPGIGSVGAFVLTDHGVVIGVGQRTDPLYGNVVEVVEYDPVSGVRRVVSGPGVGDGPIPVQGGAAALLDSTTLIVAEVLDFSNLGMGVYAIDLATGDRRLVSRLSGRPISRLVGESGVLTYQRIAPTPGWSGGEGPVANGASTMVIVDGLIYLGTFDSFGAPIGYDGGILAIEPGTGDRTLMLGKAKADELGGALVEAAPSNVALPRLDGPWCLTRDGAAGVMFVPYWGPPTIYRFDLETRALETMLDLSAAFSPLQYGLHVHSFARYAGPRCLNPADLTTTAIAGAPGYGEPDGLITSEDYFYFLSAYAASSLEADLTTGAVAGEPTYGRPNGVLTTDDFFYFLTVYSYGC